MKIITTIDATADLRGQNRGKLIVAIGTSSIGTKGTKKKVTSLNQAKSDFGTGTLVDIIEKVFINGVSEVLAYTLGPIVKDVNEVITSPVDADYQAALDALLDDETYGFILVDRSDTVIQDKLKQHVTTAEQSGKFRFAVTAGLTADAGTINSGRVWMIDSNLLKEDGTTDAPGYLVAAAVAAVISLESDPAMPVHNLAIKGFGGLKVSRLESENDTLSNGGLITFTKRNGEIVIYRAVTTYTKDSDGNPDTLYQEIPTVRTGDFVTEDIRSMLRARYGRVKNTASMRGEIATDITTRLEQHVKNEIIEGYDPVNVVVSASNSKRVEVDPTFYIIDPINEIKLSSHLVV